MSTRDPTISKRSRNLRRRHRESGDKSYLIWLSPTTQARLAKLKRQGETLAGLIDRALEALEGVANSVAQQQPEDRQRLEVWVPDDLIDSLRAFLPGGVANPVAKQRLIARAKELLKLGLNYEEIAQRWNQEGVTTLSGKGEWHRKTISRMIGKTK